MNRRKSVVQPSGGPGGSEKKHRSPFAPFKRADSARDTQMQIPEDAPAMDHPDTGVTTQDNVEEFVRGTNESMDHSGLAISSNQETQPAPAATNGTAAQGVHVEPGVLIPNTGEVCQINFDTGHATNHLVAATR